MHKSRSIQKPSGQECIAGDTNPPSLTGCAAPTLSATSGACGPSFAEPDSACSCAGECPAADLRDLLQDPAACVHDVANRSFLHPRGEGVFFWSVFLLATLVTLQLTMVKDPSVHQHWHDRFQAEHGSRGDAKSVPTSPEILAWHPKALGTPGWGLLNYFTTSALVNSMGT